VVAAALAARGGENGRRLRAGVAAAAEPATAAVVIAITLAAVTAAPRRCSDGGLATQAALRRQQRVCGNSGEEVEEGSCCCHCCGCANGWKHARRATGNDSSFWDSFTPDLPRPCQGCSVPHCTPEERWCGRHSIPVKFDKSGVSVASCRKRAQAPNIVGVKTTVADNCNPNRVHRLKIRFGLKSMDSEETATVGLYTVSTPW
jgi:hypothetical protein